MARKRARARNTCAESKAGKCCTATEAAQTNLGLGGPWAGGDRSLRLNWGPFQLEIAPEARRKGPARGAPAFNPRKGQAAAQER